MCKNPENIKLCNKAWTATVSLQGAELRSLRNATTKQDYLWHGGEPWSKVSPILFPFIDKLPRDIYMYQGKSYSNDTFPSHGFARNMSFEKQGISSDAAVTLVLKSNAETKAYFPFEFELYITYRLEVEQRDAKEEATVVVAYKVVNKEAEKDMYFSIGGHPGFQINADTSLTDYELLVESILDVKSRKEHARFLSDEKETAAKCANTFIMPLTEELLSHGCIVLEDMDICKITLQGNPNVPAAKNYRVWLNCKGFPVVALWADRADSNTKEWAKFFCLEPWHGIGALESTRDTLCPIEDKPRIVKLAAQASFDATYSLGVQG